MNPYESIQDLEIQAGTNPFSLGNLQTGWRKNRLNHSDTGDTYFPKEQILHSTVTGAADGPARVVDWREKNCLAERSENKLFVRSCEKEKGFQ